jgi:hypothetical protein
MQMANVTFDGVWDAIMAEFEHIACPAQLAHQADKISAVKHKGQSPHFKEQRKSNSAPHPATEAPHGESSVKRTRKGGKQEKAHKARAAHNIVSSALVPSVVLNRMQESHYLEAGPSTSHVEEVVEQPAPTPVTIIGGPSQAPVRSAAPISIASIQPLSVTTLIPNEYRQSSKSSVLLFKFEVLRRLRMPIARYCLSVELVRVRSDIDS